MHQKSRLKCRESPRSCMTFKDQRELLMSGVIFGITRYECFTESNLYEERNLETLKLRKKNIEPHQNFIGSLQKA